MRFTAYDCQAPSYLKFPILGVALIGQPKCRSFVHAIVPIQMPDPNLDPQQDQVQDQAQDQEATSTSGISIPKPEDDSQHDALSIPEVSTDAIPDPTAPTEETNPMEAEPDITSAVTEPSKVADSANMTEDDEPKEMKSDAVVQADSAEAKSPTLIPDDRAIKDLDQSTASFPTDKKAKTVAIGQQTKAPTPRKSPSEHLTELMDGERLTVAGLNKIRQLLAHEKEAPTWLKRVSWGLLFPGLCFTAGYLLYALLTWQGIVGPQYDPQQQGRHQVYSLNIPDNVVFAGEEVPLKDIEVYERFDRELTLNVYWQANTLLLIKRSSRWFPMIQQTLKQQGVPADFKYVAAIESMFENRFSPAGAAGFWQLMEPAAREYGLEITDEVDERFHPQKATVAACKYFKQAKRNLGTWTSALASYNVGMGGLQRSMTSQKMNNYYDLLVNQETGRYVFRLLSFKQIMENAEDYGFSVERKHLYQPFRLRYVKVSSTITDLTAWSIAQGINYKILKWYNPWLRKNSLTVASGKSYMIAFPKDPVTMAEDETDAIPQQDSLLTDSAVGDKLQDNDPNLIDATPQRPTNINSAKATAMTDGAKSAPTDGTKDVKPDEGNAAQKVVIPSTPEVQIHTVVSGESLERICKKHKIKLADLVALNNLDRSKPLKIGQKLRIR